MPGVVKWALALGVLGVLGYDGFMTVATHLKASSDAQNVAYAASSQWTNAEGPQRTAMVAYQGAVSYLVANEPERCQSELSGLAKQAAPGVIPIGCEYLCTGAANQVSVCGTHGAFSVDDNGTVHLVLRRQAKTLVFGHLGFLHNELIAYGHGDANVTQD